MINNNFKVSNDSNFSDKPENDKKINYHAYVFVYDVTSKASFEEM